jgi:hypothetical protein
MDKYEYAVVRERYRGDGRFHDLTRKLQDMGQSGWRLVQSQETPAEVNTGGAREDAIDVVLYFERTAVAPSA